MRHALQQEPNESRVQVASAQVDDRQNEGRRLGERDRFARRGKSRWQGRDGVDQRERGGPGQ